LFKQHGLLRASFVPDRPQRELRDLTRHRSQLVAEQTRVANRIHKTLEDANVKLGSVATDILGVSGWDMIRGLIGGQNDPEQLAELARGRLREKLLALREALRGHLTRHHRFMLGQLMHHLGYLDRQIRIRSANRQGAWLQFPKLIFRQITASRSVRSAWLFVGSTPSTRENVHKAGYTASTFAQNRETFFTGQETPPSNAPCSAVHTGPRAA